VIFQVLQAPSQKSTRIKTIKDISTARKTQKSLSLFFNIFEWRIFSHFFWDPFDFPQISANNLDQFKYRSKNSGSFPFFPLFLTWSGPQLYVLLFNLERLYRIKDIENGRNVETRRFVPEISWKIEFLQICSWEEGLFNYDSGVFWIKPWWLLIESEKQNQIQ